MAGEIKNIPIERLADIEKQVGLLDRRAYQRSKAPQQIDPLRVRMARTQGEDPVDPNDPTYPPQVDSKGARLPIVFLELQYDDGATDTVILTPRAAAPQAWLYSPCGWIPRLIDLRIHEQGGLWVASFVPDVEVILVDTIVGGNSGTAKITKHGAANDQEFEVWFDHMSSGATAQSGEQAAVRLREGRKVWSITNKEC